MSLEGVGSSDIRHIHCCAHIDSVDMVHSEQ